MIHSTFEYVHYPVQVCFDKMNEGSFKAALWYIGGAVAYVVNLALIPVTIVVDVIRGVAMAVFALFSNDSPHSVGSILWKFVVISPLQQLTTLGVNALFVLPFALLGVSPLAVLAWPLIKKTAEFAVGLFPAPLSPSDFSIFHSHALLFA